MKNTALSLIILLLLLVVSSCDDWVQDVEDPINLVPEEQLAAQERLSLVLTGVQGSFAEAHDQLTVHAGGLSDAQVFDRDLPQATFPSYDRLERGDFSVDDGTINQELGQLRFYADNLVSVANSLEEVSPDYEEDLRQALFHGNFLGGVARSWYATYMALEPERGGGVIDNGPFVPSSEMYDSAVAKLEASLEHATPYEERVVYSTLARIYTYHEQYQMAVASAEMGLQIGDDPFVSQHNVESTNEWYDAAGEGRVQWRMNERFPAYVAEDPDETARLPMWELEGRSGTIWSIQDKFPERSSPIPFIDWQENHLLMAELGLRTGDASVDPLALVNAVRESHGLDPLSSVDMEVIIQERDKELVGRGQRLVDQRRFDMWHLPAGTWKYFPISQEERNNNPNIN